MKKFLPFENITYSTKLETEEILKRINDNVELEKRFSFSMFFGSTSDKPYEGSITGKTFNLIRTIKYRNSCLPRAKGKIEQDVDRSKVNAKMNLHPVVLVLMLIWCGEVGIGFISIVIESIEQCTFDKMVSKHPTENIATDLRTLWTYTCKYTIHTFNNVTIGN